MSEFDAIFAEAAAPAMFAVFGDSVTYFPKGGGSRSLVVNVARRRRDFREEGGNLVAVEVIECRVLRDEADATHGGINNPQIGDGLLLAAAEDAEQRRFTYLGVADSVSSIDWLLHFSRDVIFRQGGSDQSGSR